MTDFFCIACSSWLCDCLKHRFATRRDASGGRGKRGPKGGKPFKGKGGAKGQPWYDDSSSKGKGAGKPPDSNNQTQSYDDYSSDDWWGWSNEWSEHTNEETQQQPETSWFVQHNLYSSWENDKNGGTYHQETVLTVVMKVIG